MHVNSKMSVPSRNLNRRQDYCKMVDLEQEDMRSYVSCDAMSCLVLRNSAELACSLLHTGLTCLTIPRWKRRRYFLRNVGLLSPDYTKQLEFFSMGHILGDVTMMFRRSSPLSSSRRWLRHPNTRHLHFLITQKENSYCLWTSFL